MTYLCCTIFFPPNQFILKFKLHLEYIPETVEKSNQRFPSLVVKVFNGHCASFLQLIITGRGKKSLSHQLGKITTWKVAMSSQPDAERGGNPSLCRRKGDHQLWIPMLQALQRFVSLWINRQKPLGAFCIFLLWGFSAHLNTSNFYFGSFLAALFF